MQVPGRLSVRCVDTSRESSCKRSTKFSVAMVWLPGAFLCGSSAVSSKSPLLPTSSQFPQALSAGHDLSTLKQEERQSTFYTGAASAQDVLDTFELYRSLACKCTIQSHLTHLSSIEDSANQPARNIPRQIPRRKRTRGQVRGLTELVAPRKSKRIRDRKRQSNS